MRCNLLRSSQVRALPGLSSKAFCRFLACFGVSAWILLASTAHSALGQDGADGAARSLPLSRAAQLRKALDEREFDLARKLVDATDIQTDDAEFHAQHVRYLILTTDVAKPLAESDRTTGARIKKLVQLAIKHDQSLKPCLTRMIADAVLHNVRQRILHGKHLLLINTEHPYNLLEPCGLWVELLMDILCELDPKSTAACMKELAPLVKNLVDNDCPASAVTLGYITGLADVLASKKSDNLNASDVAAAVILGATKAMRASISHAGGRQPGVNHLTASFVLFAAMIKERILDPALPTVVDEELSEIAKSLMKVASRENRYVICGQLNNLAWHLFRCERHNDQAGTRAAQLANLALLALPPSPLKVDERLGLSRVSEALADNMVFTLQKTAAMTTLVGSHVRAGDYNEARWALYRARQFRASVDADTIRFTINIAHGGVRSAENVQRFLRDYPVAVLFESIVLAERGDLTGAKHRLEQADRTYRQCGGIARELYGVNASSDYAYVKQLAELAIAFGQLERSSRD